MTTREKIAVMQAYLDGKKIEIRSRYNQGTWSYDSGCEPFWNWEEFTYRVKPEPREGWAHKYQIFESLPTSSPSHNWIKVREVLE